MHGKPGQSTWLGLAKVHEALERLGQRLEWDLCVLS